MTPKKTKKDEPEKISSDIIYQELYQEMRRYRDYELSVSTWYTTILLAILGGILAAKYGGNPGIEKLAAESFVKLVTASIILIIGGSGMWSVLFSYRRYKHIRDFVFDKKIKLEPDWKRNEYKPESIFIKPRHLILVTQFMLIAISIIAVFWSNGR